MPRKKKAPARKPAKRKKKGKSSKNLAVFLMLAINTFGLIYWLAKPIIESTQTANTTTNEYSSDETTSDKKIKKPKKTKKVKKAKKPKKIKVRKPKVTRKNLEAASRAETPAVTYKSVETSLYLAFDRLNIPRNTIKQKKKDEIYTYQIPIDPALLDLTFSNMILKGEVEKNKGQFLNGLEKNGRQFLTFYDPKDKSKHNVELFYKRNEEDKVLAKRALAIVIDDFGNINGKLLNGFMNTDPNVVFAIMPGTPYAQQTMNAAHGTGHETILHIPMEPMNYPRENPGDKAIFIQNSAQEISKRMESFINEFPYCKGANNHMGSMATADETTMRLVMQAIKNHSMYFLDSRTSSSSVAYKVAQKQLVPAFKRDIFLDEPDLSDATMNKRLAECLALSAHKPYVVTIMHCHTANHLNYLNRFIEKAKANGYEILPLSKLGSLNLPSIQ